MHRESRFLDYKMATPNSIPQPGNSTAVLSFRYRAIVVPFWQLNLPRSATTQPARKTSSVLLTYGGGDPWHSYCRYRRWVSVNVSVRFVHGCVSLCGRAAMESDPTQRHSTSLSHMSDGVQRQITDLAYRLRPEQPAEDLVYISIASEAQRAFIAKGVPLEIVVWNTFKGRRERYYDVLAAQTADADLILLQEFRHDLALEASHRDIFSGRDAGMAVSFYTRPNQEAPTGVCTVSSARSIRTRFLLSRYFEPVTKTPKMAMCTYYPIERRDCPSDQALLVLNSHGINFRLRRPFLDQMLQFEAQLRHHAGPIILVGDFNTWEKGRVRILEAVARRIGLTHLRFPTGIKTAGRPSDPAELHLPPRETRARSPSAQAGGQPLAPRALRAMRFQSPDSGSPAMAGGVWQPARRASPPDDSDRILARRDLDQRCQWPYSDGELGAGAAERARPSDIAGTAMPFAAGGAHPRRRPLCSAVCPFMHLSDMSGGIEVGIPTTYGGEVWAEISYGRITSPTGRVEGTVHVLHDLTQRKAIERLKDEFISMISHELRTPLNHIKGFATTLLQTDVEWDAATQRDFLASIDREHDRSEEPRWRSGACSQLLERGCQPRGHLHPLQHVIYCRYSAKLLARQQQTAVFDRYAQVEQ